MTRRLLPLLVLAVLLAWSIGSRRAAATGASMTGHLSAAAHEVEEGYFSIGPESYLIVKPGTPMHAWLAEHLGQEVTLSVTPAPATE